MIERARHSFMFQEMDESERAFWALRNHDHLKRCSCWMCGNPRRYWHEVTIQERRQSAGEWADRFEE
jgi:hypothetical protein